MVPVLLLLVVPPLVLVLPPLKIQDLGFPHFRWEVEGLRTVQHPPHLVQMWLLVAEYRSKKTMMTDVPNINAATYGFFVSP
jgi:hypothetical protein